MKIISWATSLTASGVWTGEEAIASFADGVVSLPEIALILIAGLSLLGLWALRPEVVDRGGDRL